jgi:hypothetical protein
VIDGWYIDVEWNDPKKQYYCLVTTRNRGWRKWLFERDCMAQGGESCRKNMWCG